MKRISSYTRITSEQARQALAEVDIPWIEKRTRIAIRFNLRNSEVAGRYLVTEFFTTVGIITDILSSLKMTELAEEIRNCAKPEQSVLFRTTVESAA
jgi:hypothetical protein